MTRHESRIERNSQDRIAHPPPTESDWRQELIEQLLSVPEHPAFFQIAFAKRPYKMYFYLDLMKLFPPGTREKSIPLDLIPYGADKHPVRVFFCGLDREVFPPRSVLQHISPAPRFDEFGAYLHGRVPAHKLFIPFIPELATVDERLCDEAVHSLEHYIGNAPLAAIMDDPYNFNHDSEESSDTTFELVQLNDWAALREARQFMTPFTRALFMDDPSQLPSDVPDDCVEEAAAIGALRCFQYLAKHKTLDAKILDAALTGGNRAIISAILESGVECRSYALQSFNNFLVDAKPGLDADKLVAELEEAWMANNMLGVGKLLEMGIRLPSTPKHKVFGWKYSSLVHRIEGTSPCSVI